MKKEDKVDAEKSRREEEAEMTRIALKSDGVLVPPFFDKNKLTDGWAYALCKEIKTWAHFVVQVASGHVVADSACLTAQWLVGSMLESMHPSRMHGALVLVCYSLRLGSDPLGLGKVFREFGSRLDEAGRAVEVGERPTTGDFGRMNIAAMTDEATRLFCARLIGGTE